MENPWKVFWPCFLAGCLANLVTLVLGGMLFLWLTFIGISSIFASEGETRPAADHALVSTLQAKERVSAHFCRRTGVVYPALPA